MAKKVRRTVENVYAYGGNTYTVTFKPVNPVEALIGGKVVSVKAKSKAEAIRKARAKAK